MRFLGHYFFTQKKTEKLKNLKNLHQKSTTLKKFTIKNLNQKRLKKRKYFTYQMVDLILKTKIKLWLHLKKRKYFIYLVVNISLFLKKAKFEYYPLGQVFNEGLDSNEKKAC